MFLRNFRYALNDALSDTPAIFLAGARQTGKSTLVQWLIESAEFEFEGQPAWSANLSKRLVRSPKTMFTDTGLLAGYLVLPRRGPAALWRGNVGLADR